MSPKKSDAKDTTGEEEVYYVGVSEPLEVRRTILETSKGIIQAMHRFEKYREYREQKQEALKKLNKQMSELGTLIHTLKSVMPKSTVRVKKAREEVQEKRKVHTTEIPKSKDVSSAKTAKQEQPKVVKMTQKRELSELEKLELELSSIESKLSSLTK